MSEKVLVLRTCNSDYTSYNGFRWPEKGPVECPDWNPKPVFWGGLHGLLWGRGDWTLLNSTPDAVWQVIEVDADDIVQLDGTVKFPRGNVIYSGGKGQALTMVLCRPERPKDQAVCDDPSTSVSSGTRSIAVNSGTRSIAASSGTHSITASGGFCSTAASSGVYSRAASSGDSSEAITDGTRSAAASAGYCSRCSSTGKEARAASSGDSSHASASGDAATAAGSGVYSIADASGDNSIAASSGERSKANSKGDYSIALSGGKLSTAISKGRDTIAIAAGDGGVVSAGENGCFAAVWYHPVQKRYRLRVGYVGQDGIRPNTRYQLTKNGQWVEVVS